MVDNFSIKVPSLNQPRVARRAPVTSVAGSVFDGIGEIADAAVDVGLKLERAQSAQQVSDAQIGAYGELNDLVFEFESGTETDIVKTPADFVARGQEIKNRIAGSITNPDAQTEFSNRFDALLETRRDRLRSSVFQRAKDGERAKLFSHLGDLAKEVPTSGPSVTGVARLGSDLIDGAVSGGWITQQEAVRYRDNFKSNVNRNAIEAIMAEDPQAALEALDDENFASIDPGLKLTLTRQANQQIRALQAEDRATLKHTVAGIKAAGKQGLIPDDVSLETGLDLAEKLGDDEAVSEIREVRAAATWVRNLQGLSVRAAQQQVNDLARQVGTGASGSDATRLKMGRRALDGMRRALIEDPLAFAHEVGIVNIEPLDFAGDLPASLQNRAVVARRVSEFYGSPKKFFTTAERVSLESALNDGTAASKQTLLSAIAEAAGTDAPIALSELGHKSPVDAHLATLASVNPDLAGTAQEGFRGADAIRQKAVTLPKKSEFAPIEDELLSGVFDSRTLEVRARVSATARTIYAARMLDKGLTEFDPDEYRSAVKAAAGQDRQGRGGIGQHNRRGIMLPSLVTQDEFDFVMSNLTDKDLTPLSAGGGAPVHITINNKRKAATADEIRNGFLLSVGDGRYQVSITNPAEQDPQLLIDRNTGRYYTLDIGDRDRWPEELPRRRSPYLWN